VGFRCDWEGRAASPEYGKKEILDTGCFLCGAGKAAAETDVSALYDPRGHRPGRLCAGAELPADGAPPTGHFCANLKEKRKKSCKKRRKAGLTGPRFTPFQAVKEATLHRSEVASCSR